MEAKSVTFSVLQSRLISQITLRINNGEFSERALARMLSISQPQMHNVRKGVRKLSVCLSDRILAKFGISILDLLEPGEVVESLDLRSPNWREREMRKPARQEDGSRAPWRSQVG
jgi:transcriptional regulator with XRE-family HTH domain